MNTQKKSRLELQWRYGIEQKNHSTTKHKVGQFDRMFRVLFYCQEASSSEKDYLHCVCVGGCWF
jgi:hypothetical protein